MKHFLMTRLPKKSEAKGIKLFQTQQPACRLGLAMDLNVAVTAHTTVHTHLTPNNMSALAENTAKELVKPREK